MTHQSVNPTRREGQRLCFRPGEFGSSQGTAQMVRTVVGLKLYFQVSALSGNLPYYRVSTVTSSSSFDQYHYWHAQTLKYALPMRFQIYVRASSLYPHPSSFPSPSPPPWTVYALCSKPHSSPRHTRNVPGWSLRATIGASLALISPSSNHSSSLSLSRLKKIKCVQIKSQPRCEACEAGNTTCQFRDRERYFAE